uniref:Uncharacterized protein n=1 Tax=Lotus japonicus TaxID=34305 RepID=I3SKJ3_LOTJA|nr:unknown [Lotus japonicus]
MTLQITVCFSSTMVWQGHLKWDGIAGTSLHAISMKR